jgi:hypothetical protein
MNAAHLIAWIDDDGLASLRVTQQGAVTGQRADGKGLKNHDFIVGRSCTIRRGRSAEFMQERQVV